MSEARPESAGTFFLSSREPLTETALKHYDEAVRNVLKQIPSLADVIFQVKSYEEITLSGCLVYCDPPYEGTTKYIGDFDHSHYWEWVRRMSENNIVICSEYAAPDDFVCIWEMERTTTLDKASRTKAIERLFVRRGSGGVFVIYLKIRKEIS